MTTKVRHSTTALSTAVARRPAEVRIQGPRQHPVNVVVTLDCPTSPTRQHV